MDKNRNEKGRFIKGHKTNIGKRNALGPHIIKNPESFRKMRSERMKGNKINLGRECPERTKRKLSEIKKGTNKGKQNSNWKGGIYSNIRKYMREYMRKNSEKIREWYKQHRKAHPEYYKIYRKRWRETHLERCNLLIRRYRARKKGAEGFHTLEEWELLKKQYSYKCPVCGKREPEIKLEEDHIIPLSKGGSDYIKNIQPLCRSCNSIKGVQIELQISKGRWPKIVVGN